MSIPAFPAGRSPTTRANGAASTSTCAGRWPPPSSATPARSSTRRPPCSSAGRCCRRASRPAVAHLDAHLQARHRARLQLRADQLLRGQTFIVRKSAGIKEPKDLDGAAVCVAAGSTEERNATDWFRERNLKINIVKFEKNDDAIAAYDSERCDTYTAGTGALAGQRRKLKNPADHVILAGTISRDPQGPVTREGDDGWDNVIRWVFNGTLIAELHGVTAANVDKMRADSRNAEVRMLLGADGNAGQILGLSKDWMFNAIKQVGNYGEQFERSVGMGSDLKLERGYNQLWTKGGLMFTPVLD